MTPADTPNVSSSFDAVMGRTRGISETHELARQLTQATAALAVAVSERDAAQRERDEAREEAESVRKDRDITKREFV